MLGVIALYLVALYFAVQKDKELFPTHLSPFFKLDPNAVDPNAPNQKLSLSPSENPTPSDKDTSNGAEQTTEDKKDQKQEDDKEGCCGCCGSGSGTSKWI